MDNAADALKMAGSVMIFVMALSIVIFAFSQARESSDIILNYRDRETMYIDGDYYYMSSETKKARQVGIADVIPTVERAFLENYVVVFLGLEKPIYTLITPATSAVSSKTVEKYSIDLSSHYVPGGDERNINMVLGTSAGKMKFLEYILYGADVSKINEFNSNINSNSLRLAGNNGDGSSLKGIDEQLKSKHKITEYLGVYYEEDNAIGNFVPDAQKIEKRIVTYICNDS